MPNGILYLFQFKKYIFIFMGARYVFRLIWNWNSIKQTISQAGRLRWISPPPPPTKKKKKIKKRKKEKKKTNKKQRNNKNFPVSSHYIAKIRNIIHLRDLCGLHYNHHVSPSVRSWSVSEIARNSWTTWYMLTTFAFKCMSTLSNYWHV